MNATRLAIPDLVLFEPAVHRDERGFFMESYNATRFDEAIGESVSFVQDNHSRSSARVLRGLHYQLPPHAQGKLVRVTSGVVFDVAVDIRRSSAAFGRWVGVELSAENARQLWIPPGFAHGFLVLSEAADFLYKTTAYWSGAQERSIHWADPQLAIRWPGEGAPVVSKKDSEAPPLARADLFP
jgi:dTDP-4-dehydrorhamnose 3,5-epimerase